MIASANTKIERVTESIESLALAVVSARVVAIADAGNIGGSAATYEDVKAARLECREALADFIKPLLRVA